MHDQLLQSMIRTVAFFDIFDHPLTDRELFDHLYLPGTRLKLGFAEFFLQTREYVEHQTTLRYTEGMWHLPQRDGLVLERTSRSVYFEPKMRALRRAGALIRRVPFVRAVFVCNTVAFSSADRGSDIDVLVIVKSRRMWTARLIMTLLLSVFGLRRTRTKIAHRICLSFYLADRSLNISKLRIAPDDVYLAYWLKTLIPIYDPDQLSSSMFRANQEVLSAAFFERTYQTPLLTMNTHPHTSASRVTRFLEYVLSRRLGNFIERNFRVLQRKKILSNPKSLVHVGDTRVVASDTVLKFHENDRRLHYRDEWYTRCMHYGV